MMMLTSRTITNLFTQVEVSHMANYWRDFLSMTDELIQNVHAVHMGRVCQLSASHAAMDGSV